MSGYYPSPGVPQQPFGYPQQPPPGPNYGPPPVQFQQPPQGQFYNQGPPPAHGYNQYGQPPLQPGFQHLPQPGYNQPPPQQFQPQQFIQATPASLGYGNEVAQGNANLDVDALIKALSGFKRDHTTIIRVLAKADPVYMALIRQTYLQRTGSSLESKVESSFRGDYGDVLLQLVRGPLLSDVYNINRAIKGLGTKEDMLNDVLIGRSNADIRAIKSTYQSIFKRTMESDVDGDLSLKTKTMFQLIMRASRTEDAHPYNPVEINRDAEALYYATRGPSVTTNQEQVFTILTQRSDNQIRAIGTEFQNRYHKSIEDIIHSSFSGHMEDALSLAVVRAMDRAKADAFGLEDTMKGLGTKDDLLVNKTVRVHWNKQHVDQVKKAYQHFFKKDLISRVKGETSGDYRDALVACLV